MSAFAVVSVAPTGSERAFAFGIGEHEVVVYPPHPDGEALRQARVGADLGLREAAKALGVTPAVLSGLEFGRYRFERAEAWAEAAKVYAQARRP